MHAAVEFEARPEETRVETRQHLVEREGGAEEPSPGEHVDQLLRGLGHCRRDDRAHLDVVGRLDRLGQIDADLVAQDELPIEAMHHPQLGP
jgi:hypothetical protein